MTNAPPVPPPSYWPDLGGEPPSTSKPPGWAVAISAGAAVVALLGGGLIAVRNAGSEPPPVALPTAAAPSAEPSGKPSDDIKPPTTAEPGIEETADAAATPGPTSTFPTLTAVPEVCDLLSESLTSRLAPGSLSEPGVAKDGYGALRKDCRWSQKGPNIRNGYNEVRSISVKVNVFADHANARKDAEFMWRSMRDFSDRTQGDPYNSKHGEITEVSGIGDEAYAIYKEGLERRDANAWIYVLMGNATIDIRYFGGDNPGREILAGKNTRPVPEAILMRGVQQAAKEAAQTLRR